MIYTKSTELIFVVCLVIPRCHGEEGNVVYELARDKNLLSSCPLKSYDYHFARSNGETIPAEISEKLAKLKYSTLNDEATGEMKDYNGSLGDFYARE